MKTCKKCGEIKSFSDFHKHPNMADGHLSSCKMCKKAYRKEHYEENKGVQLQQMKEWRSKNPGYGSEHRRKNPEYYKKAYQKTYAKNRHNFIRRARARETQLYKSIPSWLTEEHKQQIKDLYWLAKDLQTITGEPYHVDHIVPLQGENVSGLHVPWNLQVLPADINLRKKNKHEP